MTLEEDDPLYTVLRNLAKKEKEFDHSDGKEKIQPLSIAVFGAPGCGKSFGVKQIAESSVLQKRIV